MKHYNRDMSIALIALVICGFVCGIIGYYGGIKQATQSDGWVENGKFVLQVNGHQYEWFVE